MKAPHIHLITAVAMLAASGLAQAHPGHGAQDFVHGLVHPVSGIDHLLAMVAVGAWAAQLGGAARYRVPLVFLAGLAAGGAAGMMGVAMPGMELAIALTVLMLGVMIAAALRLPFVAGGAIVAAFAAFHGLAHGAEAPAGSWPLAYAAGFVVTSAALHFSGVAAGGFARSARGRLALRGAGIAVAGAGAALALGLR